MRRLAFGITLLALGPAFSGCGSERDGANPEGEARVARVELVDAAGLEAKIAAHRGRGLLVNLWAVW
jgi:hypothetical protein